MQVVDVKAYKEDLSVFFKDFQWNYIPDAIREGSMGRVLVDNPDNPQTVVLTIPEFKVSFVSGDPNTPALRKYIDDLPFPSMLMLGSDNWKAVLRDIHPGKWAVIPRFGFSSESLDAAHLQELKDKLSNEFRIEKIDMALAKRILSEKDNLTEEQLFGFSTPEDFMARGLGYCALLGDEMVSIAAAGAACAKGIEIQINTRKKFEGCGLGTAVASTLILDCLAQGIDPNWDAATEISAGLAKKLGYTPKGQYRVYVFLKFKFLVKLRDFLRRIRGKETLQP